MGERRLSFIQIMLSCSRTRYSLVNGNLTAQSRMQPDGR